VSGVNYVTYIAPANLTNLLHPQGAHSQAHGSTSNPVAIIDESHPGTLELEEQQGAMFPISCWALEFLISPTSTNELLRHRGTLYTMGPLIGEGTFGEVFKANIRGSIVAAKRLRPAEDERDPREALLETYVMERCINVPCIVQFLDLFWKDSADGGNVFIVMELWGTDVASYMQLNNNYMAPAGIRSIVRDTLSAIQYLNLTIQMAHTDIKPANVLVVTDNDMVPTVRSKVTDFASCHQVIPYPRQC
jgi:serine/threonine protein kinase